MPSASPFVERLHTNYTPLDSELNHIRALVDERQTLVIALNREIEELIQRRDEHLEFMKDHSALLSPIRRVPNDVLTLILFDTIPHNPHFQQPTKSTGVHPALVLSHVCQRWRRLVFNTPLFWNVVDIKIPQLPHPRDPQFSNLVKAWERLNQVIYKMVRLWISRSASSPLTVSFESNVWGKVDRRLFSDEFLKGVHRMIRPTVGVLCEASTRWKSLHISVAGGDYEASARIFEMAPDDIPILQNLSFTGFPVRPDLPKSLKTGTELLKGPSLQRLAFGVVLSSPSLLPVDWSKITELSLGALHRRPGHSYPLSTLSLCPNLTRCSITFPIGIAFFTRDFMAATIDGTGDPKDTRVCRLPRLRTLELRGSGPPVGFADKVDLPSLRELLLYCNLKTGPCATGGGALDLIQKFGEGLTDVAVDSSELDESSLGRVFEWLPNVVSLRFVGCYGPHLESGEVNAAVPDSLLERLIPKCVDDADSGLGNADDGHCGDGYFTGVFCPKLEKFGFNASRTVGFSQGAIVRFIASRRKPRDTIGISELNSVVVTFHTQRPGKTIREALEEMDVENLEDMVLIARYKTRLSDEQLDFGYYSADHEDYLKIVAPLDMHT